MLCKKLCCDITIRLATINFQIFKFVTWKEFQLKVVCTVQLATFINSRMAPGRMVMNGEECDTEIVTGEESLKPLSIFRMDEQD
jgi:hypothetical protein